MKNLYFSFFIFLALNLNAQYFSTTSSSTNYNSTINHAGQINIGNRPLNNTWFTATLQLGKSNNEMVTMNIANSVGALQFFLAGKQWEGSDKAMPGDAVWKMMSGKNMIFNFSGQPSSSSLYNATNVQTYSFSADNNFNILNVYNTGKITMGTEKYDLSGYRLFVKDGIKTERLKVEVASANQWADHVFNDDYNLMPLNEVKSFINANKHLPNIPSAKDVVADGGIEQGELNAKLLEKIEELTLHLIQQNEKIELLQKELETLKK